jgi:predicted ribosomally synthesized peptide with SipW-like signal peptide
MNDRRKEEEVKNKTPFLAFIVIVAVVVSAMGGTLAHFSDTEESVNNTIEVGAMDLKVGHPTLANVWFDDPDVPVLISTDYLETIQSEDFEIPLKNVGQPADDPCHVYVHFKEVVCENIDADHDPTNGIQNPEPEDVAQWGGKHAQTDIAGLGDNFGDNCSLADWLWVNIEYPYLDPNPTYTYSGYLGDLVCTNVLLGALNKGDEAVFHIDVKLNNIDEDDPRLGLKFDGVDNDGDGDIDEDGRGCVGDTPGVDDDLDGLVDEDPKYEGNWPDVANDGGYFDGENTDVSFKSWDHWPTNALMKDKITFKILFSLVEGP